MNTPLIFSTEPRSGDPLRRAIDEAYVADEAVTVAQRINQAQLDTPTRTRIFERARTLVQALRDDPASRRGLDAFLQEYDLSNEEGVVLMCLAEALLRIPDADTADRLIREKLAKGQWDQHLGQSGSALVNASTWGLMLTGRLIRLAPATRRDPVALFRNLIARGGEPLVRLAMREAMEIIGHQFVLGETIEQALERSARPALVHYLFSYDMLGEAAVTAADAQRFFDDYIRAIDVVGASPINRRPIGPAGISLKLSALHPRYEYAQRERVVAELVPRLSELARLARDGGLQLTVDAEECDRLELSLDVFERVFADRALGEWDGLGIAVQCYQKRALPVLAWLAELGARQRRRIPVRLTKGAYWDAEIKRAQQQGLRGYPVYTRKHHTDVSMLACMRLLLANPTRLYPQIASHNAHTIAAAIEFFHGRVEFEFQRLHGMGQALYDRLLAQHEGLRCRVYAPVGGHAELLPYLVRRLLENGANTSFVNRIVHRDVPAGEVVADPVAKAERGHCSPHPEIPLPRQLFGDARINSLGVNLVDGNELQAIRAQMAAALAREWRTLPIIDGAEHATSPRPVVDPSDHRRRAGEAHWATDALVRQAVDAAQAGFAAWRDTDAGTRAERLDAAADLLEHDMAPLVALCVREGGKTVADAVAEVREAVDFCRYYAAQARARLHAPAELPGPSGESNTLGLHGRGPFVCISPWNFPLAIFLGQITAALATGNTVLAKPAEQTPLIAARAVRLLHQAGVPHDALHLLPGDGTVGAQLVSHPQIAGVAFTGSIETAQRIQRSLAAKDGPIVPLIAETGGQNAMIVDSSALAEQVVKDAVRSAFNGAGQRCSALRVLFVQDDVGARTIDMLRGAMAELVIGDPALLRTDVGPVIDDDAKSVLEHHIEFLAHNGRLIHRCTLPDTIRHGTFVAPHAFEIESLGLLTREVFGPILHVIRYPADALDAVIDDINATGYGLTLGIHSRIEETIAHIIRRARVGNIYVNRDMIGAVVGVQPFGGEGLSGTGPKAGGPNYLPRFCTERTVTNNIAAVGGNAALLSLSE